MIEREILIVELSRLFPNSIAQHWKVADFILADRKRIVEPLLKIKGVWNIDACVSQTLKNAGYYE